MKAILVIDMPSDCASGCPVKCRIRGINHRPSWCPLKPMPEKLTESKVEWGESRGYQGGWNDCIEEIEDETD